MVRGEGVDAASSGDGLRAWADLRIVVPAGQQVAVHHGVGRARVSGVEGTIVLDLHSGPVQADGVRGAPAPADSYSGRDWSRMSSSTRNTDDSGTSCQSSSVMRSDATTIER